MICDSLYFTSKCSATVIALSSVRLPVSFLSYSHLYSLKSFYILFCQTPYCRCIYSIQTPALSSFSNLYRENPFIVPAFYWMRSSQQGICYRLLLNCLSTWTPSRKLHFYYQICWFALLSYVSNYFYCRIQPEGLLYDAERDLLAIANFLV